MPDWGKVEFHSFPTQAWEDILPGASSNGRDLVSHLLCYESSERLSATEVCDVAWCLTINSDISLRPLPIHILLGLKQWYEVGV